MRKVVLYIAYGEDQHYYDGVKFSVLTFLNWISKDDGIEIVVLTEKPEQFISYPVKTFLLSDENKFQWSIGGTYHFRIKNRGFAYIMDQLKLTHEDKIIFFDADTYFKKSPLMLFNMINPAQALFYLNEGLIYKRSRFQVYVDSLEGKSIPVGDSVYELKQSSEMWGSLIVGIMPNMRHSLDWADLLMLELHKLVPAHTIEPFSLAESLLKDYKLLEGKGFIKLYSTSRKKEFATSVLSNFFRKSSMMSVDEQIKLAQKTKIKRSITTVVKQRLVSLFK